MRREVFPAGGALFCLMASYMLLRPVRDDIGIESDQLELLWTWGGGISLAMMPLYARLISRLPKRLLPMRVLGTVAAALAAFLVVGQMPGMEQDVFLDSCFYVASSLYPMFVVSVFWSCISEITSSVRSKRIYGTVMAIGTVGGMFGSGIVSLTADREIHPDLYIMLAIPLVLTGAGILRRVMLDGLARRQAVPPPIAPIEVNAGLPGEIDAPNKPLDTTEAPVDERISHRFSSGLSRLVQDPYLSGIAVFLLLFVLGSGFLYFLQRDFLRQWVTDRGERRQLLANMDLAVQALTLAGQAGLAAPLIRWLGLPIVLGILPLFTTLGFTTLAVFPALGVFVVFYVARRAANFALAKPCRETLFTVVPPNDRFLTKPVLDVAVYRCGDVGVAWLYAGIAKASGFGVRGMSLVAIPFCLAWIPLAMWLGRKQEQRSAA